MAAAEREVFVPDIGDFKDVEIIEVLVKPGDAIRPEDSLITLESDKAAMEVPSPVGGIVKTMKVKAGDRVNKGSPILVMEIVGEAPTAKPELAKAEPAPPVSAVPAPTASVPPAAKPAPPITAAEDQEIVVPDIGDFKDVEIIEVLVKPGDVITAEASLITLESDKAAMEVPTPVGGKVKSLNVKAGDRVSKGTPILVLEVAGAPSSAPTTPPPVSPPAPVTEIPAVAESAAPPAAPAPAKATTQTQGLPPHASPAIRRFARELGADLARVTGTGPKGRILKEDVQKFIKEALKRVDQPVAASAPGGFALPPIPALDFSKYGPVETQTLSRIQKLSGPFLHRNWVGIPHVTQHEDADITDLEDFRKSLKGEADKRGLKLSFLPFVMKAVVGSLKAYPSFNASLAPSGEELILKQYFNIGVAVDTPGGLVVPVIRDVDQKSVYALAAELMEVSAKARDGKLRGPDLEGGCFTISSLGGIGGTAFTPIINAPEVAILGLSRSQTKPLWDGKAFQPRLMLPLSLSYDHRVIDGAQAARFIVHLSGLLADLRRVLL